MLARGKSHDEALNFLANTLTNKLLPAPSANLRAAALRGDGELLQAAARLYHVDPLNEPLLDSSKGAESGAGPDSATPHRSSTSRSCSRCAIRWRSVGRRSAKFRDVRMSSTS